MQKLAIDGLDREEHSTNSEGNENMDLNDENNGAIGNKNEVNDHNN